MNQPTTNLWKKLLAIAVIMIYAAGAVEAWGQTVLNNHTYYLRNRESKKFLTGGNNWGTEATLHDTGIDFTVTIEDGKYVFDSKVMTNSDNHYLSGGFVDGKKSSFSVTPVTGTSYFTISPSEGKYLSAPQSGTVVQTDGTDANSSYAHWEFVTREQLIAELSGASRDNPKNATFFIQGFNFNRNDTRNNSWKGTSFTTIGGYKEDKGNVWKRSAEMWNNTYDVYQELTDLPSGIYRIRVQAFYRYGTDNNSNIVNAKLYAGYRSVFIPSITTAGNSVPTSLQTAEDALAEGKYQSDWIEVEVTSGKLTIGIKKEEAVQSDWTVLDNFQLEYLGPITIPNPYTGSGTFYLQNVATGEYLEGGAEFGVRLVLGNGIDFRLEKVNDGIYNIYSGIEHTEGYLCDESYLDHGKTNFVIQEVSPGSNTYTIATTDVSCNNLNPQSNGTPGRMLTASGVDLKDFTFNNWSQNAQGGTINQSPATGFNNNIGNDAEINRGDIIFGDGNVNYLNYTDLTGYSEMRLQGTPHAKIQIRINRKDHNTDNYVGDTENIDLGEDGQAVVDLSKYEYIHLNSIKHAWESSLQSIKIESITLYKKDSKGILASFAPGVKSSAAEAQWKFVTEDERTNFLRNASPMNPQNATFMIKGASFTQSDTRHDNQQYWKTTNHRFLVRRDDGKQTDGAGGIVNSDKNSDDVYQEITNLPNGLYEVSMQGCYTNFNNAMFYAIGESEVTTALDIAGSEFNACNHQECNCRQVASISTYGTDNYKKTIQIKVNNGTLRVGVKGQKNNTNNLLIFDNFKLTYLGNVNIVPYYMRNVATGKFIRAGGRDEAQAILDDWGLMMNIIQNYNNNLYAIDTRITSDKEFYQCLGINGFMNSVETYYNKTYVTHSNNGHEICTFSTNEGKYLTATENGLVEFRTGTSEAYSQWELVTRNQLINELWSASENHPKDATFLIQSPNFGRNDLRTHTDYWKGVTFEINDYSAYGGVESTDLNSPDNYANHCVEQWNKNFDIYQDLDVVLPAGIYELSVQAFYRSGSITDAVTKNSNGSDVLRPFVYVKQGEQLIGQQPLFSIMDTNVTSYNITSGFTASAGDEFIPNSKSDAAKAFRDDYYTATDNYNKVRFVVTTGGTVRIGVKKNNLYSNDWSAFDNFRLTYLGTTNEEQKVYTHEIGSTWGTFYLKNKNTGTYLTAGGADGVSAMLGDLMYQHSIYKEEDKYKKGVRETDFTFVTVGSDQYLIQTGIGDGYLTTDSKINGQPIKGNTVLNIQKNNDIYYIYYLDNQYRKRYMRWYADQKIVDWNISSGDNPGSAYQWVFQTKEELTKELNPEVASENNPIDATFLLHGTAFHKEDSRNSVWRGNPRISGEGGPNGEIHSNHIAEVKEPQNFFDVSQKITGVPNGIYEFTLQGYFKNTENGQHVEDHSAYYYTSTDGKSFIHKNLKVAYYGPNQPNNPYEASTLFEAEDASNLHEVIRFRVENGTIILGVYRSTNPNNNSHPDLFIDNVRLTYLGTNANNVATPTTIVKGIKHKRSRFYDLAAANGHLSFDNYNTVNEASNKTNLSNQTMVRHEHIADRMLQHTPVYRDTIYAKANEKLQIVLPASYTDKAQASSKYYQRLYNYRTDDLFEENAETKGIFDLSGYNQKTPYTDTEIRGKMQIFEGSATAPAGGWVFGERWGQQLISQFQFITPTNSSDFDELTEAIEIGVDYTDMTDVGDMEMFGDLTEPTLVQRAVFVIVPANVMATKLNACDTDNKFLEVKSISFPTIWHGLYENDLNAVALDKQIRNYFTDSNTDVTLNDLVVTLTNNGTGIRLATSGLHDGLKDISTDGLSAKFNNTTSRFIQFKYPEGGHIDGKTNKLVTEYLYVKTLTGKNVAKFILDFVPNTELRPWKDIMGHSEMRRSPIYLEEHAVLMDKLNFDKIYYKDNAEVTLPATWPIGDEQGSINGIEGEMTLRGNLNVHFNPYPLNFDQTTFGAYYPRAIWSQYSVMKRLYSYRDIGEFQDVNQLYHDHYALTGTSSQQNKYPGGGHFMYIDASNFPSSIATLHLEDELCSNTTIHFSGWVSSMDKSTDTGKAPGYLLFSIVGIDNETNKETVIESFCPGPIRADAKAYDGTTVEAESYHSEINWTKSYSIWQQFAFSFVINTDVAKKYKSYALKIDNYCSSTSGGDMMIDDVRLYIQKAVPDIVQSAPICLSSDTPDIQIYSTFDQLLNAVTLDEADSETEAYYNNGNVPTAWYCFIDKQMYNNALESGKTVEQAFNETMVNIGGNNNDGYYRFSFSSYFESNDGGKNAHQHKTNDVTDYTTYTANGQIINNGETEQRIYLNPTETISLHELPFIKINQGTQQTVITNNIGKESNTTIYGSIQGEMVHYVNLTNYKELRIYQTEGEQAVRCFFFNNDIHQNSNFTVSNNTEGIKLERVNNSYWKLDLQQIKNKFGCVKLISIKGATSSTLATVSKIDVVNDNNDVTSLTTLPFYVLNGPLWIIGTPDWNINTESTTIYGSYTSDKVHYVDLTNYSELHIYQKKDEEAVRCFFFDNAIHQNSNFTVSSTDNEGIKLERVNDSYWKLDLQKIKNKFGFAKLISIKGATSNTLATVSKIEAVRTISGLTPNKEYELYFSVKKEGETPYSNPATFFNVASQECANTAPITLISGTELRYDGTLKNDGQQYCEGQIATIKMEMQAINQGRSAVKEEDLFYDWWIGDIHTFENYEDYSPKKILEEFRDAYPEATIYEGQPAKDDETFDFTEAYRQKLEQWVEKGKFLLYRSSLNVRVESSAMHISVMPIVAQLEALTGMAYCKGPLDVFIPVGEKAPTVKNGFQGITYPTGMEDVPVRIGLSQLKKATDESGNIWNGETTASLYIPLRPIAFSNSQYTNFGKKKKNWSDTDNTLDIAAVYLAETDDPDMVAYEEDQEGNRNMRYVGKVHDFKAALGKGKFEDYLQMTFNPEFTNHVKEGYRYTLKTSFIESDANSTNTNGCHGDLLIPLYIVPEYQVWTGGEDGDWANDDNWRRAENDELKLGAETTRFTNVQNTTSKGFVPMKFTHVLMKKDSIVTLDEATVLNDTIKFHNSRKVRTPNIMYHMATQIKEPPFAWFQKSTDIYCEPFYTNTAKEVHFEPHSQMLGSQHLNYEKVWVEYALESGRWYTLSSPLKGVVSGDMYLPRGTVEGGAKQETPYFEAITYNNTNYTRLTPAVYQQAWDKTEAMTYRLERAQLENKRLPQKENETATVNVARAFNWSSEYNDVKVPFGLSGFSVKVDMSDIDGYTPIANDVLLRLPKDDKTYQYYLTDDRTSGSETEVLTRNGAGKLFTDEMKTGNNITVTLTNKSTDNPYFLIGNPFMSGLDLGKFFKLNQELEWKYWILTKDSYLTGIKNEEQYWLSNNGTGTGNVAPLQAFIVKKKSNLNGQLTITFTTDMAVSLSEEALQTRVATQPATLQMTAIRNGKESHATIVCNELATPNFNASEDVEALFDSHLSDAPTLYTMAGDMAASINVCRSIHGLPVGVQSDDNTEVDLTFNGVELFNDELYLYDMESRKSTPITSSKTTLRISGKTMGRYFLVTTPIGGETVTPAITVKTTGDLVTVTSVPEEIASVAVYDVTGRRIYSDAPNKNRTSFPLSSGIYMVTVKTENYQVNRKVKME